MHPAIGPALATFLTSFCLAIYVMMRREKELLHWMLLGFLMGLGLWTGGTMFRFNVTTPEALTWSVKLIFTGIVIGASFWLLSAAAYVRPRGTLRWLLPTVVMLGSTLLIVSLLTNERHGYFMSPLDERLLAAGPASYAGPLFWAFLAWNYVCVSAGMFVYMRAARTMMRTDSKRRGMLLALAAAIPLASSTLYVFQLVPLRFDLTPTGLMFSMLLLCVAVFRYHLFESLPLARGSVITHLDDAVVMASAGGRITEWNPAAERILPSEDLGVGQPLSGLVSRLLAGAEAPGTAPRGPGSNAPVTLRTHDGRVLELTTAVVDEGRGDPAGQFVILSDRTEVDRMEQLARQAQRLEIVGSLAADVAHEIQDPLSLVRANLVEIEGLGRRVDVDESEAGPDAELARELEDLRAVALETLEGVDRMRRIVEDMRGLALGDMRDVQHVDLAQVVRDAIRLAQLDGTEGEGPVLQCSLQDLPSIPGNADSLVQVVLNLLMNSRQALRDTKDARVSVKLARRGRDVELVVQDNGPGIPAEVRHRIFDPFFTTRGPDEGTGLGLAIAYDIAREHGGSIEERTVAGRGACFALRLPIRSLEAAGQDAGAASGRSRSGGQVDAHEDH